MCTAVTFKKKDHYFGRNLDLEYHYQEAVTITQREYPFAFRFMPTVAEHFGIIGMATVFNGYPLYYDAANEYGLSMAGLNFPDNAVYYPFAEAKNNIAPFEFIPWILGQCRNLQDAKLSLQKLNITGIPFHKTFPLSPLHWIIADQTGAITVETLNDGMRITDNPVGILTNNPPFDYHLQHIINYLNLTAEEAVNRFSDHLTLKPYSRGMGAIGLPGDLSSASRFVRGAFTKWNSKCGDSEKDCVCQFFHILSAVEQQQGCVNVNGAYEKTVYSSCINMDKRIYYYTTYENRGITGVYLHNDLLAGKGLVTYPLKFETEIVWEN